MNIAIDIRCLTEQNRTGVGRYTHELLNALFLHDTTSQYFLFYNSWKDVSGIVPVWDQANVHVIKTRIPNKLFHVVQWLKVLPIDFVVEQQARKEGWIGSEERISVFFSPNLHFTSLRKGVVHVQTIHDLSFEHLPECYTRKQRLRHWLLRPKKRAESAHAIIVPSQATKMDVLRTFHISEERIQVVYPGVPSLKSTSSFNDLQKKYQLPEQYLLFVGALEPRKHVEVLLEAYSVLQLQKKGIACILAGAPGWKNRSLHSLIKKTPGVQYLGYVAEEDKPGLYERALCLVYPSLYEGFGMPVLEAMSAGTSVITTNRTSLPEVTSGAAYLINPLCVDELTQGLERIMNSLETRTRYIQRGLGQAKKFSWIQSAQKLHQIVISIS